jgi:hypothetical protein
MLQFWHRCREGREEIFPHEGANMSAEVWFARTTVQEEVRSETRTAAPAERWNPESFGNTQIRGLVRQIFLSHAERPVRQVVFSAVDQETDVRNICRRVGEALALETLGSIAVVGDYPQAVSEGETYRTEGSDRLPLDGRTPLRQASTRVRGNLWLAPVAGQDADRRTIASLHSYLAEIRREFEYSIVETPFAGESNETTAMAQFADGIILVLSAHRTRRILARKIKDSLEAAGAHILGTILIDRTFPIPERIYRRL